MADYTSDDYDSFIDQEERSVADSQMSERVQELTYTNLLRRRVRTSHPPAVFNAPFYPTASQNERSLEDFALPNTPLQELYALPGFAESVAKCFNDLLFKGAYLNYLRRACERNESSLTLSFQDLASHTPLLAKLIVSTPLSCLRLLDEGLTSATLSLYPEYHRIHPTMKVRVSNLNETLTLRELRNEHTNTLVQVRGIVTRRSTLIAHASLSSFDCMRCGSVLGPFYTENELKLPRSCSECGAHSSFKLNSAKSMYTNLQKLSIQESPNTLATGRVPRQKEVILTEELVDSVAPGDEIELVGCYRSAYSYSLNTKNGFPVFSTLIEANAVRLLSARTNDEPTQQEIERMKDIARKNPLELLLGAFAPSIHGQVEAKTCLLLALLGGVPKECSHRVRGDLNVLLVGDPGTAKSQLLRYVGSVAHRAVNATGKGASAVGLTACVRRDVLSKRYVLEGGALVLANTGVCCIDEFDKMGDEDRTSIHEAMEQQTISISKAGIVATLNAKCSVVAAANPRRGRYNPGLSLAQNVELSDAIISRFDLVCVVRDEVNVEEDRVLAEAVVRSHAATNEEAPEGAQKSEERISQDFLRRYIAYARSFAPRISQMDVERLSKVYSELRKERTGVTVRFIESIVRVSEAFAKLHLRESVRSDDVESALSVCLNSFIGCQKSVVGRALRARYGRVVRREAFGAARALLHELVNERVRLYAVGGGLPERIVVSVEEYFKRCKDVGVADAREYVESSEFKSAYTIEGEGIVRTL